MEDAIRDAFAATEGAFIAEVASEFEDHPDAATVGSCCLVGVVHDRTLFVADLGDSRAVLGKKVGRGAGQIVALKHWVWNSGSLGDAYLKDAKFNTEQIKPKFRVAEPFSRPIMSADPSIVSRSLQPSDCFLFLMT
jgi:pyruvate dehydrogenase phosphatase